MKKIIGVIYFVNVLLAGIAQGKNEEHLLSTKTSKDQLEKFSRTVKDLEKRFVNDGGTFDSSAIVQMLQIAQQAKSDSLLAISYNWIGSYMAFDKGNNIVALEYYFKALPLAEKVNDKRRISSLYFDIALIYFNLEDNEKAGENIRKGGENLPDRSSAMYNFMLAQYQRNMAIFYLLTQHPDSALHYAQATLETAHHLQSPSFEHGAWNLTASAYKDLGDKEMAEISFKRAKVLNDSVKLNSIKVPFFAGYVSFLLSEKKVQEAYQQARELLSIAVKENNDNMKLAADTLLKNVFDSMHRLDSAYYYLKLETSVNASLFSRNNINKLQSLAFNEQLRNIEETAKKDEERRRQKENIQYILIAFGIVFLLILYLLLSRSFITNKGLIEFFGVVALLIVFEFFNLVLHPFLESITHHTPILMLLSLVCIAALLVPLHHKLEKWAIAKLIEKNKKIRLAVAKKTIEELDKNA